MKRALLCWAVFFHLLIPSCTKQSQDTLTASAPSAKIINATLSPGQAYVFNAGFSGTMNISRQALHYQVSEVTVDSKDGAVIYTYVPAVGYKGADEVTLMRGLSAVEYNDGGCQNHHSGVATSSNLITIKITVAN